MPAVTLEEIERHLLVENSWKAPGDDGLPVIVWEMMWHTVKHSVLELFQASVAESATETWRPEIDGLGAKKSSIRICTAHPQVSAIQSPSE